MPNPSNTPSGQASGAGTVSAPPPSQPKAGGGAAPAHREIRGSGDVDRILAPKNSPDLNPLPGVMDSAQRGTAPEPDDFAAEMERVSGGEREPGQPKPASAQPQRDANGRFLSSSPQPQPLVKNGDPGSAPEEGEGAEGKPPVEPPPTATGKLRFLDREYSSLTEIEQQHKTLQGNFKAAKDEAATHRQTAVNNYNSSEAWRAEAQRVSAELEQLKSGKSPASAPTNAPQPNGRTSTVPGNTPESASEPKSFSDSFDWGTYHQLQKVNPVAAEIFKTEAVTDFVREEMEAKYGKRFETLEAPVRQTEANTVWTREVAQEVANLANAVDDEGNAYYPELSDPVARKAIMEIWSTSGLPRELAKTPYVIASAVAHYRLAQVSNPSPSPRPAPSPTAQAAGQAVAQEVMGHLSNRAGSTVIEAPPSAPHRPTNASHPDDVFRENFRKARSYGDGKNNTLPGVLP